MWWCFASICQDFNIFHTLLLLCRCLLCWWVFRWTDLPTWWKNAPWENLISKVRSGELTNEQSFRLSIHVTPCCHSSSNKRGTLDVQYFLFKEATREHYLQYWADNGTVWFPLVCFKTALIRSEKQGWHLRGFDWTFPSKRYMKFP